MQFGRRMGRASALLAFAISPLARRTPPNISLQPTRLPRTAIHELFTDDKLVARIQERLSSLFYLAEMESSRAGKVGMEVGSARERIIIALLIYKFGEDNAETDIPITQPEIDVKVFDESISIKTITGKNLSGVKLIWTVDAEQALSFSQSYSPRCDILLIQVNWENLGWLYLISKICSGRNLQSSRTRGLY